MFDGRTSYWPLKSYTYPGDALPKKREKPPHGHLMVEDALAGVEPSVTHLELLCSGTGKNTRQSLS